MTEENHQAEVFRFFDDWLAAAEAHERPKRVDTHANTLFLRGDRAYKLKQAVKYPFLDYSTLALRKEACFKEISYNRPNAPQIYVGTVAITREADGQLSLNGNGPAIDYAVEMHRFDFEDQLDQIADRGELDETLSHQLAKTLFTAHGNAPVRREAGIAFCEELRTYVKQNATAFQEFPHLFLPDEAEELSRVASQTLEEITPLILERARLGEIRLCHGDAHLRNIVLIDGEPVLFDAIEFSDAIATIDTLYDLAFLLMDLWDRGQYRAANLVFNRYMDLRCLKRGGFRSTSPIEPPKIDLQDEQSLFALPFYLMMRACIRAKIAAASIEHQSSEADRQTLSEQAKAYFQLARSFLKSRRTALLAVGGLSGTGKSTLCREIAHLVGPAPGARILRTDLERKSLLGLGETDKAPAEAYSKEATDAVYKILERRVRALLEAHHAVIFDAVFADQRQRQWISALADTDETPFCGLWLTAPEEILTRRVSTRQGDVSDADEHVVRLQQTYEIGQMAWDEVDASGSREDTLTNAQKALSLKGFIRRDT